MKDASFCKSPQLPCNTPNSHRPCKNYYPFLTVDATYFKVRENSRIISKALMIVYGTNAQGHREIIGFGVNVNTSTATWTYFFMGLKKRGLTGVLMITSDAHEGILVAIGKVFPTVPWQRCQFHFIRNITNKTTKKYQAGLRAELQLKRHSKVIGVFPNEDSVLRLMGSVLIELHDAMLTGRAVFSKDTLAALIKSDVPAKLVVIAGEQQQLRVA